MWRSEITRRRSAGLSLFEAMITLAVLALVLAITIPSFRGPSPQLFLQAEIARLAERAAFERRKAVERGTAVVWHPEGVECDGEESLITFFPDGTARGQPLCLEVNDRSTIVELDLLTGRLQERAE